jgi:hypothetical protein
MGVGVGHSDAAEEYRAAAAAAAAGSGGYPTSGPEQQQQHQQHQQPYHKGLRFDCAGPTDTVPYFEHMLQVYQRQLEVEEQALLLFADKERVIEEEMTGQSLGLGVAAAAASAAAATVLGGPDSVGRPPSGGRRRSTFGVGPDTPGGLKDGGRGGGDSAGVGLEAEKQKSLIALEHSRADNYAAAAQCCLKMAKLFVSYIYI